MATDRECISLPAAEGEKADLEELSLVLLSNRIELFASYQKKGG